MYISISERKTIGSLIDTISGSCVRRISLRKYWCGFMHSIFHVRAEKIAGYASVAGAELSWLGSLKNSEETRQGHCHQGKSVWSQRKNRLNSAQHTNSKL